jgi:hypothetical protein
VSLTTVELAVADASNESIPLIGSKSKYRSFNVLTITYLYKPA